MSTCCSPGGKDYHFGVSGVFAAFKCEIENEFYLLSVIDENNLYVLGEEFIYAALGTARNPRDRKVIRNFLSEIKVDLEHAEVKKK